MARIVLLALLVAAATIFAAKASDVAPDPASVQPGGEELTLEKAARAKKDAGYPYGGTSSYSGYSYNRPGYSAYPTAPGYIGGYNTGYNTGYNQDWGRSYNQDWARTYNQYDPRYQYQQPGFYPTAAGAYDPRYNYYNRAGYNSAGYPGYAGYGGYDARTATGYGGYSSGYGGARYPYEDRFYSNYPYNSNYNRYPNDYNRRTNYDSRYGGYQAPYTASGYGGYNNYNTGYNYNSGYGSYPNFPVTQEYYYSPAASNNVYSTGYNSRYLKKRDGKDPAVAASAEAPVASSGPTPSTPVA